MHVQRVACLALYYWHLLKSVNRAAEAVCFALCWSTLWQTLRTLWALEGVYIAGCHLVGLALLVFSIVDMGFLGFMWVALLCFPFGLLQVLENFSCWVVGASGDGRCLLLWFTPVIQETEVQRVLLARSMSGQWEVAEPGWKPDPLD